MKPLFDKIAIVGVGLIGGSLGLDIRHKKIARQVTGISRRPVSAREALGRKAVDEATTDLRKGVKDADLVILAGPVGTILDQLKILPSLVSPSCIVIDVGSTKTLIQREGDRYFNSKKGAAQFIGCHPMAGSEKAGVRHAQEDLFLNSVCFLTRKNARVESFWRQLGALTTVVEPEAHDAWVARSSHLPHVLAFCLFQDIVLAGKLSGVPVNPSIRALARLAKSDPDVWTSILESNKAQLLDALDLFKKQMEKIRTGIRKADRQRLRQFIEEANRLSNSLLPE